MCEQSTKMVGHGVGKLPLVALQHSTQRVLVVLFCEQLRQIAVVLVVSPCFDLFLLRNFNLRV